MFVLFNRRDFKCIKVLVMFISVLIETSSETHTNFFVFIIMIEGSSSTQNVDYPFQVILRPISIRK